MSLTEFEIIDRYFRDLTTGRDGVRIGIGDDAAVLCVPAGCELVCSVDTLVSGVHFLPDTDPFDLGFKSLAVNLSDLAAMAATPRWLTLALTLPGNDAGWLERFAGGLGELAGRHDVALVGGDLTRGSLTISIQIMGTVPAGEALPRSGARAGDLIFVSGYVGGAGLALRALLTGTPAVREIPEECRLRLLRPEPRLALGVALRGVADAAIDISDGLAADLGHLLAASAVGAVVELERIPIHPALELIPDRDEYWNTVLGAGDDYELCFTASERAAGDLAAIGAALGLSLTRIGRVVAGEDLRWLDAQGRTYLPRLSGYRHF